MPRSEFCDHQAPARGDSAREHVEVGDRHDRLDPLKLAQTAREVGQHLFGTLAVGGIGQDRLDEERTDVLVRDKAGRGNAEQQHNADNHQQHEHGNALQAAGRHADKTAIALGQSIEPGVEASEEPVEEIAGRYVRLGL